MVLELKTVIALIEEGVILIPKFIQLWTNVQGSFSSDEIAAVNAALIASISQDAKDTAQADIDLAAAANRT